MVCEPYDLKLALGLFCFVFITFFCLQSRIGVTDIDSYAYLVGAYSLDMGFGYKELTGAPLNHWPPGYSWLLSVLGNYSLWALILNYFGAALATSSIFLLARNSGWTRRSSVGLSLAMGFGFLRVLATIARPDTLTYGFFLLGTLFYLQRGKQHFAAYWIWSFLIPIKLVAVFFTPLALFSRWLRGEISLKQNPLPLGELFALLGWGLAMAGQFSFNYGSIGKLLPSSFQHATLSTVALGFRALAISIPRQFLTSWNGSVATGVAPFAFGATLLLSLFCLSDLRWRSKNALGWFAGLLFLVIVLLSFRQTVEIGARISGYCLLLGLLCFRPSGIGLRRWLAYGIAAVVGAIVNSTTVNNLGVNDERYKTVASLIAMQPLPKTTIPTNSYHLMDLHAGIATEPKYNYDDAKQGDYFLRIIAPNYDPMMTVVRSIPVPGPDWCPIFSLDQAQLFQKCKSN